MGSAAWCVACPRWPMPRLAETALLTLLALVAFASNSILTRHGAGQRAHGCRHVHHGAAARRARWCWGCWCGCAAARSLVAAAAGARWSARLRWRSYAAPFSFAYVRIGAAAGALLLFGAVQITMIGWGIFSRRAAAPARLGRHRTFRRRSRLAGSAVGGPAGSVGSALMVVAGCAWGDYSLPARGPPMARANARSFIWALPRRCS